jgi:hypothetical protein
MSQKAACAVLAMIMAAGFAVAGFELSSLRHMTGVITTPFILYMAAAFVAVGGFAGFMYVLFYRLPAETRE